MFVDTNVLIYAFDQSDARKHFVASQLVIDLMASDQLVISVQVLNEFYWASTRPHRKAPIPHNQVKQILVDLSSNARVVSLDSSISLAAVDAVEKHSISFWDALIWASARAAGCSKIFTEDFQSGQVLDGVTFENPFA